MSILKNKSAQKNSLPKIIFCSILGSVTLFIGTAAVLAFLMVNGNFSGSITESFSLIALCVGAFCCSWISVKMIHHGALICAFLSFCLYGIVPLFIGMILGTLELTNILLIQILLVFICSFIGGIIGTQKLIGKRKVG